MDPFRLFQLPAELLQLTFYFFVVSRDFKRAMRLRLVNQQFKTLVDETIFRYHIFHLLAQDDQDDDCSFNTYEKLSDYGGRSSYNLDDVPLATTVEGRSQQDWLNYIYPYLSAHALQGPPTGSPLYRVHRVAQAICKLDGDSGTEAVGHYVRELIPFAAAQASGMPSHAGLFLGGGPEPTDEALEADVRSAAVWLGKAAYIERLVAEGVRFCQPRDVEDKDYDCMFDHPLVVAAIRGDIEMIKTILGALEPPEEGELDNDRWLASMGLMSVVRARQSKPYNHGVLIKNGLENGHREVIEFALESDEASCVYAFLDSFHLIPWVDICERAKGVIERHSDPEDFMPVDGLVRSVSSGCTDTVRYHLRRAYGKKGLDLGGPAPDMLVGELHEMLCRAVRAGDESIVRLLLEEAHVDLRGKHRAIRDSRDNPLQLSVIKGRIAIIRLLLDHGADPNGDGTEGDVLRAENMPPIVSAIVQERLDIFRLLRERGALLHTPRTGGAAMEAARK
ncbi:hypothetical protein PG991_000054 [Apiospora marii]|uniref:F-box domain-containing protein n=1 Tax=Apiospora marii TaxID=335849 RepID=A0ABR1T2I3_9PEZI